MLYLLILLAFIFFTAIAMCVNEGLWNNTITLISVILCGISAFLFGVPLGNFAVEKSGASGDSVWYYVFGVVWIVFAASIFIFRLLTEKASGVRMKFIPQLDTIGGLLMGFLLAVLFTSFASLTILRIPIKAGYWDMAKAPDWQKQAFQTTSAPFYHIVKRVSQADGARSSLIDK